MKYLNFERQKYLIWSIERHVFLAGKLKYLNLESFEQKKNWILGQKLGYSHKTVWAPLLFCQGAELM